MKRGSLNVSASTIRSAAGPASIKNGIGWRLRAVIAVRTKPGIYFIRVRSADQTLSTRVVRVK